MADTLAKMELSEALALLRADLMPQNVREYCRRLPDGEERSGLLDLATELESHRHASCPDHAAAFRAVSYVLGTAAYAYQAPAVGEALACAFGAPVHAMCWAPYCAVVEGCLGPGAMGNLLAAESRYTPYYSAACQPAGRLLEQLESLLTDAVTAALSSDSKAA